MLVLHLLEAMRASLLGSLHDMGLRVHPSIHLSSIRVSCTSLHLSPPRDHHLRNTTRMSFRAPLVTLNQQGLGFPFSQISCSLPSMNNAGCRCHGRGSLPPCSACHAVHSLQCFMRQHQLQGGAWHADSMLGPTFSPDSGVPLDSPLEGHSLWDSALITPGLARSYLFYFFFNFSSCSVSEQLTSLQRPCLGHPGLSRHIVHKFFLTHSSCICRPCTSS